MMNMSIKGYRTMARPAQHTGWRYDEHVDQRVQDHGETSTAVQGGDMMNMSIKGYRTMARPALLYRVEI